jgi:NAD+ synthase
MSSHFLTAEQSKEKILTFIKSSFQKANKQHAVIAVSGGIDSAVSLTLLTEALGTQNVTAVLLPHHNQPMEDARTIVQHLGIPKENTIEIDIKPLVDVAAEPLGVQESDLVRRGNLKARVRMMCVFDIAKRLDALVCGTENKSEHYLGYFTRFGDAASDLEPISHLYKTQVRELAAFLQLPQVFLEKPPSAGLWIGQTDEEEMGFSYAEADQVLEQLIDHKKSPGEIHIAGISATTVQNVLQQVQSMQFKREVPYTL